MQRRRLPGADDATDTVPTGLPTGDVDMDGHALRQVKLSDMQSRIAGLLHTIDHDVPITSLYKVLYGSTALPTLRQQQQRVGRIITPINVKLERANLDVRIKPGVARSTSAIRKVGKKNERV